MPLPTYHKVNCHITGRARATNSKHLCLPGEDDSFSVSPALLRITVELFVEHTWDIIHRICRMLSQYYWCDHEVQKWLLSSTLAIPRVLPHHSV